MIADLIAGQIYRTINGKSVLLPHIKGGKVRALAVTAAERSAAMPDVPKLIAGLISVEAQNWSGPCD